jgi:hypothetical protein
VSTAPSALPALRAPPLETKPYAWLNDATVSAPKPVETLHARFPAPDGFTRRSLDRGTFGSWLRELPLAEKGTPVRAFDGSLLHEATDPRIASVIAIDIGKADLQQCADAVMRFHAEWKWSKGERDMSYRAAAGTLLPFERWAKGERISARGMDIAWTPGSGRVGSDDHGSFRKFMDAVFAWANTVSLEKQAKPVAEHEARAGDFFILPGNPGHSVLILEVVTRGDERLALLGQSYMPAQSPQVLSIGGKAWFSLDASKDVTTPFWRPFPWSSLRRLD